MAKKIKIDKKKLKKPDEFITFGGRMVNYLRINWKRTLLITALVFGGLGIYTGLRYYSGSIERRTLEDIARAVKSFQEGKDSDAFAVGLLEGAAKRGGDRPAGMISRLYLGNHFFQKANYERALEYYEAILSRDGEETDPLLRELALMGAGYSLEHLGRYAEATSRYQEAANNPDAMFGDSALASAARCLEQQGKLKAAAELYRRVEAEYPDSPFLADIRARLTAISPTQPSQK